MSSFLNHIELSVESRPKLSTVAPLTSGIINVLMCLNLFLGLTLFMAAPNARMVIVGSYTMSYFWVAVFVSLAGLMAFGKVVNNWQILKMSLIAGLFVQAIFTYALIVLGLSVGFKGIIGITSLWLAITGVQFHTVKNFKVPGSKHVQ